MKMKKSVVQVIGLVLIAAVVIVVISLLLNTANKEKKKEIITKSTLEKIINVSELSTFEAVYNGIAEKMNEKNSEKVDYYVSYEATVKAGIDFEQIDIKVDDDKKLISVTIPEVEITDVNVDIASMDFIFENKKANQETVTQEAYKICIEDVTNESQEAEAIYKLAEQNAKNIVEALVSPFVKQLDSDYELEINQGGKQE